MIRVMAAATVLRLLTVEEYLVAERDGKIRHKYLNGELVAMTGGRGRTISSRRVSLAYLEITWREGLAASISPT